MTAEAVTRAAIPAAHRRWIVVNALCITAVLNAAVNTGIALGQAHGDYVVAWSINPLKTTLLGNTLGTLFMLPLITTLLVSLSIRREQRIGSLVPIEWPLRAQPWEWLSVTGSLRRGWRLGVATFVALAPIDVILVVAFGRHGLTPAHFAVVQVVLCVTLGAALTPLIALAAMCDSRGLAG